VRARRSCWGVRTGATGTNQNIYRLDGILCRLADSVPRQHPAITPVLCASGRFLSGLDFLFQVQRNDVLGNAGQVRNHLSDGPAGTRGDCQLCDAIAPAHQRIDTLADETVCRLRVSDRHQLGPSAVMRTHRLSLSPGAGRTLARAGENHGHVAMPTRSPPPGERQSPIELYRATARRPRTDSSDESPPPIATKLCSVELGCTTDCYEQVVKLGEC
jgi:hypothetical protein